VNRTDTVVIGAGQAGLATSRLLVAAGRDHVVLERGRIAERWRSERWDSLRLLTPNWMLRLPGHRYEGDDPDGFMTAAELADRFDRYALGFDAPVRSGIAVDTVRRAPDGDGYVVATDDGTWRAQNVVAATGWCGRPALPRAARDLAPAIDRLHSSAYRSPRSLPDGGVLVVGASASGVQIADELRRDGREVVLAAGAHTRLPRRYRGRDILWWLDRMGVLDARPGDIPREAQRQPSMQLIGRAVSDAGRRDRDLDLDLASLAGAGVRVTGRLRSLDGSRARFARDLHGTTADAERRLRRLLDRIDRHIDAHRWHAPPAPRTRPAAPSDGPSAIDLKRAGIRSVVWATGHRPHFPWLDVPVFDHCGAIDHHLGVTAAPGLYVVGMRWQTRRSSTFIDGVRHDASAVVDHLLARRRASVAA
jgi:putative flavoprotein involved in K+ transport